MRFLDPVERSSEVLFGLIMVVVYTGSISVSAQGQEDIRAVLVGAIGCNLAWAIIDAAMYLMDVFAERARGLVMLQTVRRTSDRAAAWKVIGQALPTRMAAMLSDSELEALRRRLVEADAPSANLAYEDYMAALGVFLLVFLSTFPVVIPFVVMDSASAALHVSQFVAMAMLFATGRNLGKHAGRPPWRTGLTMVVIGGLMSLLTYALGG